MRTVGVVSETEALQKHLNSRQCFVPIEEDELLSLLSICCDPARPVPSRAESQIVVGLETPASLLARSLEPPELTQRPLFGYFSQTRDTHHAGAGSPGGNVNYAALFRSSESAEEKAGVVVESLVRKLARALSIEPKDVDADQPLHAFGVDSLVAVELRNWIMKDFAADVPVFEIMGGRTVAAIGELVTKTSQFGRGG